MVKKENQRKPFTFFPSVGIFCSIFGKKKSLKGNVKLCAYVYNLLECRRCQQSYRFKATFCKGLLIGCPHSITHIWVAENGQAL